MIAFLAVYCNVAIAQFFEIAAGKLVVRAFGFLQAEHVGTCFFQEALHEAGAQPYGVDVPGRNGQAHRISPSIQSGVKFCCHPGKRRK